MAVRIYLKGRLAIEVDGEVALDERQFPGRQGRLGFAYLTCERARPVTREELAEVIWAEEPPPAWEEAVSALMSKLRRLLSHIVLRSHGTAISGGFGQYQLALPDDAWIDLEAANFAIDAAEGALRGGDHKAAFGPATVTATILRRPFLSGVEGEWVEAQREKQQRQLLRALNSLTRIWLLNGEPDLAVEAATEAVTLDPYRESSYQLLMRAYAASGNRPKALSIYQDLRHRLTEELGLDPSVETEALYLEILG